MECGWQRVARSGGIHDITFENLMESLSLLGKGLEIIDLFSKLHREDYRELKKFSWMANHSSRMEFKLFG